MRSVDRFTTQRPSFANDDLFQKLQSTGVVVNANPPDQPPPIWQQLLVGFGPTLLFLADSLAFHGPERAEPADDPRLWPNVAAAALGGRAELVAGIGLWRRRLQCAEPSGQLWGNLPLKAVPSDLQSAVQTRHDLHLGWQGRQFGRVFAV